MASRQFQTAYEVFIIFVLDYADVELSIILLACQLTIDWDPVLKGRRNRLVTSKCPVIPTRQTK